MKNKKINTFLKKWLAGTVLLATSFTAIWPSITFAADQILTAPTPSFNENVIQANSDNKLTNLKLWYEKEANYLTTVYQDLEIINESKIWWISFWIKRVVELPDGKTPEKLIVAIEEIQKDGTLKEIARKVVDGVSSMEMTDLKVDFKKGLELSTWKLKVIISVDKTTLIDWINYPYELIWTKLANLETKPAWFWELSYNGWARDYKTPTNSILNLTVFRSLTDEIDVIEKSNYKYEQLVSTELNSLVDATDFKVIDNIGTLEDAKNRCSSLSVPWDNWVSWYRLLKGNEFENLLKNSNYLWDIFKNSKTNFNNFTQIITEDFVYHFTGIQNFEEFLRNKSYTNKNKTFIEWKKWMAICVLNKDLNKVGSLKNITLWENEEIALTWLNLDTNKLLTKKWNDEKLFILKWNNTININNNTEQNVINTKIRVAPWYLIKSQWEINISWWQTSNADWYKDNQWNYVSSLYYKIWENWAWKYAWSYKEIIEKEEGELFLAIWDNDDNIANNTAKISVSIKAPITASHIKDNVLYSRLYKNINKYDIELWEFNEDTNKYEPYYIKNNIKVEKQYPNGLEHLWEERISDLWHSWLNGRNIAFDWKYYYTILNNQLLKIGSWLNWSIKGNVERRNLSFNFWNEVKSLVYLQWYLYIWYSKKWLSNYITRINTVTYQEEDIELSTWLLESRLWNIDNAKIEHNHYIITTDGRFIYNIASLWGLENFTNNKKLDEGLQIRIFDPFNDFVLVQDVKINWLKSSEGKVLEKIGYYTDWAFVNRDYIFIIQKDTTSSSSVVVVIDKNNLEYVNKFNIKQDFSTCWNSSNKQNINACPISWLYDYYNDRVILRDWWNSNKLHFYKININNVVAHNLWDYGNWLLGYYDFNFEQIRGEKELKQNATIKNKVTGIAVKNNNTNNLLWEIDNWISWTALKFTDKNSNFVFDTWNPLDLLKSSYSNKKWFAISTWIKFEDLNSWKIWAWEKKIISQEVQRWGLTIENYNLKISENLDRIYWQIYVSDLENNWWLDYYKRLNVEADISWIKDKLVWKWANIIMNFDWQFLKIFLNWQEVGSFTNPYYRLDNNYLVWQSFSDIISKNNIIWGNNISSLAGMSIDELAIWWRSLTKFEIEDINNKGKNNKPLHYINLWNKNNEHQYKISYNYDLDILKENLSYIRKISWERIWANQIVKEWYLLQNSKIKAIIAKKVWNTATTDNTEYTEFNWWLFNLVRQKWNSSSVRIWNTWIDTSVIRVNNQVINFDTNKWAVFRANINDWYVEFWGVKDNNMVVPVITYMLWDNDEVVTWILELRNESDVEQRYDNMEITYWLSGIYNYIDDKWSTKNNINSTNKYVVVDDTQTDDKLFFGILDEYKIRYKHLFYSEILVGRWTANTVTFKFNDLKIPANWSLKRNFYIGSIRDTDDNTEFYNKLVKRETNNVIISNWDTNSKLREFTTSYQNIKEAINKKNTTSIENNLDKNTKNIVTQNGVSTESDNKISYEFRNTRYIRVVWNWNNVNCWFHPLELQAYEYKTWENVAKWKTVRKYLWSGYSQNISRITDWDFSDWHAFADLWCWESWYEIDLWEVKKVSALKMWNHYAQPYRYNIVRVEVSEDKNNWMTVYNGNIMQPYTETADWKWIPLTTRIEHNDKKWTNFIFPWFNKITGENNSGEVNGDVIVLPFNDDTVISIKKIDKNTGSQVWEVEYKYLEKFWKKYTFWVNDKYNYEVIANKDITLLLSSFYNDINKNNVEWDEDGWSYDTQVGREILLFLPGWANKRWNLFISHPYNKDVTVNITDKTNNKLTWTHILTKNTPYKSLKNVWENSVLYITSTEAITVYYWLGDNPWFGQMVSPVSNRYVVPTPWTPWKKVSFSTEATWIEDNIKFTDFNVNIYKNKLKDGVTKVIDTNNEWHNFESDFAWKFYAWNFAKATWYRNNIYSDNKRNWIWNEYEIANVWHNKATIISDEANDNIELEVWKKREQLSDEEYENAFKYCWVDLFILNNWEVFLKRDLNDAHKKYNKAKFNFVERRYSWAPWRNINLKKRYVDYYYNKPDRIFLDIENNLNYFHKIPSSYFDNKKIRNIYCNSQDQDTENSFYSVEDFTVFETTDWYLYILRWDEINKNINIKIKLPTNKTVKKILLTGTEDENKYSYKITDFDNLENPETVKEFKKKRHILILYEDEAYTFSFTSSKEKLDNLEYKTSFFRNLKNTYFKFKKVNIPNISELSKKNNRLHYFNKITENRIWRNIHYQDYFILKSKNDIYIRKEKYENDTNYSYSMQILNLGRKYYYTTDQISLCFGGSDGDKKNFINNNDFYLYKENYLDELKIKSEFNDLKEWETYYYSYYDRYSTNYDNSNCLMDFVIFENKRNKDNFLFKLKNFNKQKSINREDFKGYKYWNWYLLGEDWHFYFNHTGNINLFNIRNLRNNRFIFDYPGYTLKTKYPIFKKTFAPDDRKRVNFNLKKEHIKDLKNYITWEWREIWEYDKFLPVNFYEQYSYNTHSYIHINENLSFPYEYFVRNNWEWLKIYDKYINDLLWYEFDKIKITYESIDNLWNRENYIYPYRYFVDKFSKETKYLYENLEYLNINNSIYNNINSSDQIRNLFKLNKNQKWEKFIELKFKNKFLIDKPYNLFEYCYSCKTLKLEYFVNNNKIREHSLTNNNNNININFNDFREVPEKLEIIDIFNNKNSNYYWNDHKMFSIDENTGEYIIDDNLKKAFEYPKWQKTPLHTKIKFYDDSFFKINKEFEKFDISFDYDYIYNNTKKINWTRSILFHNIEDYFNLKYRKWGDPDYNHIIEEINNSKNLWWFHTDTLFLNSFHRNAYRTENNVPIIVKNNLINEDYIKTINEWLKRYNSNDYYNTSNDSDMEVGSIFNFKATEYWYLNNMFTTLFNVKIRDRNLNEYVFFKKDDQEQNIKNFSNQKNKYIDSWRLYFSITIEDLLFKIREQWLYWTTPIQDWTDWSLNLEIPAPWYEKIQDITINPRKQYTIDLPKDSTYIIKEKWNNNHNFHLYHWQWDKFNKNTFTTVLKSRQNQKLDNFTLKEWFKNQRIKYSVIGDVDYLDTLPKTVGEIDINNSYVDLYNNWREPLKNWNPTQVSVPANHTLVLNWTYWLNEYDLFKWNPQRNFRDYNYVWYSNGIKFTTKQTPTDDWYKWWSILKWEVGQPVNKFSYLGWWLHNNTNNTKNYELALFDWDKWNNWPNPIYKIYWAEAKFYNSEWEDVNNYIIGNNNEKFLSFDDGYISKRNLNSEFNFDVYEKMQTFRTRNLNNISNPIFSISDVYTSPVKFSNNNWVIEWLEINRNTTISFNKNELDLNNNFTNDNYKNKQSLIEAYEFNENDTTDHIIWEIEWLGKLWSFDNNINEANNPIRKTLSWNNKVLLFDNTLNKEANTQPVKFEKQGTIIFKWNFTPTRWANTDDNWMYIMQQRDYNFMWGGDRWDRERNFIIESHRSHYWKPTFQIHLDPTNLQNHEHIYSCQPNRSIFDWTMKEFAISFDTDAWYIKWFVNWEEVGHCNLLPYQIGRKMKYHPNWVLEIWKGLFHQNKNVSIDYVKFYNVALSQQEIYKHYRLYNWDTFENNSWNWLLCVDIENNVWLIESICYSNKRNQNITNWYDITTQYKNPAKIILYWQGDRDNTNSKSTSKNRNIFKDYITLYWSKNTPTKIVSIWTASLLDWASIYHFNNIKINNYTDSTAKLNYIPNQNLHTPDKPLSHSIQVGKIDTKPYKKVRYIRYALNGSTQDAWSNFMEIKALEYGTNTNVAKNKTIQVLKWTFQWGQQINRILDDIVELWNGANFLPNQETQIQVDLRQVYNISEIKVWHHFWDWRAYKDKILEISENWTDWEVLYDYRKDGIYKETSEGKTYNLSTSVIPDKNTNLQPTPWLCWYYYQFNDNPKQHPHSDSSLRAIQKDLNINFDWWVWTIHNSITLDNIGIKWKGIFQSKQAWTYTFRARELDDGIKIFINWQQVLNHWEYGTFTNLEWNIDLKANTNYNIEIYYFEWGWHAKAKLDVKYPWRNDFVNIWEDNTVSTCDNNFNIINTSWEIPLYKNPIKKWNRYNSNDFELSTLFLKNWLNNNTLMFIDREDNLNQLLGIKYTEEDEISILNNPEYYNSLEKRIVWYHQPINLSNWDINLIDDTDNPWNKIIEFTKQWTNDYLTAYFEIENFLWNNANISIEYDLFQEWQNWWGIIFGDFVDINSFRTGSRTIDRYERGLPINQWNKIKYIIKNDFTSVEWKFLWEIYANWEKYTSFPINKNALRAWNHKIGIVWPHDINKWKTFVKNLKIKILPNDLSHFDISNKYVKDDNIINYTNWAETQMNTISIGRTNFYNEGKKEKPNKIKYIRSWQQRQPEINAKNSTTHIWSEIQLLDNEGNNILANATNKNAVSLSTNINWNINSISNIIDNDINTSYSNTITRNSSSKLQYVQLELDDKVIDTKNIVSIWISKDNISNYDNPLINYRKLEISEDGVKWYVLFDSEIDRTNRNIYSKEVNENWLYIYPINDARYFEWQNNIRYIRLETNWNNRNNWTHLFEIEANSLLAKDEIWVEKDKNILFNSNTKTIVNWNDNPTNKEALFDWNYNWNLFTAWENKIDMWLDFERFVHVDNIKPIYYYPDGGSWRLYYDRKISVSQDGIVWYELYNYRKHWNYYDTYEGLNFPTMYNNKSINIWLSWILRVNGSQDYIRLNWKAHWCIDDNASSYVNYHFPMIERDNCKMNMRIKAWNNNIEFVAIENSEWTKLKSWLYKSNKFSSYAESISSKTDKEVLSYYTDKEDNKAIDVNYFTGYNNSSFNNIETTGWKLTVWNWNDNLNYISNVSFNRNLWEWTKPSLTISNSFKSKLDWEKILEYWNTSPNNLFKNKWVRYIRNTTNWSNLNAHQHWTEIMAIEKWTWINRALWKPVSISGNIQENASPTKITDWIIDPFQFVWVVWANWSATIDLWKNYDIEEIKLWHYYVDIRYYKNNKLEVSTDWNVWTTIYDSNIDWEYMETEEGKSFIINWKTHNFKNRTKYWTILWSGNNIYTHWMMDFKKYLPNYTIANVWTQSNWIWNNQKYWWYLSWDRTEATWDLENQRNGNPTLKVKIVPETIIELKNNATWYFGTNQPKMKPNTLYRAEVWTKSEMSAPNDDFGNNMGFISILTADSKWNSTNENSDHTTNWKIIGNKDWQKRVLTFRTSNNTEYWHLELRYYWHLSRDKQINWFIWFDLHSVKLEEITNEEVDDTNTITKTPITLELANKVWLNKDSVIEAFVKFDGKTPEEFNIKLWAQNEETYNVYFGNNDKELLSNLDNKFIKPEYKFNNFNTWNHIREIKIFDKNGINQAKKSYIQPNTPYIFYWSRDLNTLKDDDTTGNYVEFNYPDNKPIYTSANLELYETSSISNIQLWSYYSADENPKRYYNKKIKVSKDGVLWNKIYDSVAEWDIQEENWNPYVYEIKNKTNWTDIMFAWYLKNNINSSNVYRLLIPVSWTSLEGKEIDKISFETKGAWIELWDVSIIRNYSTKKTQYNWNNIKVSFDLDVLPETKNRNIIFGLTTNNNTEQWYKVIFSNNSTETVVYKNWEILWNNTEVGSFIKPNINKYKILFVKLHDKIMVLARYTDIINGTSTEKTSVIGNYTDPSTIDLTNAKLFFSSSWNKYKVSNITVWQAEKSDLPEYLQIIWWVEWNSTLSMKVIVKNDLGMLSEKSFELPKLNANWDNKTVIKLSDLEAYSSIITDIILVRENINAQPSKLKIKELELIRDNELSNILIENTDKEILSKVVLNNQSVITQTFVNTDELVSWFKIAVWKTENNNSTNNKLMLKLFKADNDWNFVIENWNKVLLAEKDVLINNISAAPNKSFIKLTFTPVQLVKWDKYIIELTTDSREWLYVYWNTKQDDYKEWYSSFYEDYKWTTLKEWVNFDKTWNNLTWIKGSRVLLGKRWTTLIPEREQLYWNNLWIKTSTNNVWIAYILDNSKLQFTTAWTIQARIFKEWTGFLNIYDTTSTDASGKKYWYRLYFSNKTLTFKMYLNTDNPADSEVLVMVPDFPLWNMTNSKKLPNEIVVSFDTKLGLWYIYNNWEIVVDFSNIFRDKPQLIGKSLNPIQPNVNMRMFNENWMGANTTMIIDYINLYNDFWTKEKATLYNDKYINSNYPSKNSYLLPYDLWLHIISKDSNLDSLNQRTYDVWTNTIKEVDWDLILEWYDAGDWLKKLFLKWNATFRVKGNIIINADEVHVINDNSKTWTDAISYIWFITDNDIIIWANTKILHGWYFARGSIKTELSNLQLYVYGLLSWDEVDLQNRTYIKNWQVCRTDNNKACSVVIEFDKRLYKRMPPLFFKSNNQDWFSIKEQ